ncbi:MAG: glycosyltransferase family 4 protein [Pseudomonadota bacterium]
MKVTWLADSESPHIQRWIGALESFPLQIEVHSIPRRRPRFLYLIDLVTLVLKLRKNSDGIVHAHFVSSYGVIAGLLPARFQRVVSVWGSDVLLTPKLNPVYRLIVKWALTRADICVANSQYLADAAVKISDVSCRTIPFGIDLQRFPYLSRQSPGQDISHFSIGIVKRLHRVAGIDILLRSFALLRQEFKNISLNLTVIGSGPEETDLRSLADQLGIQDAVTWSGWLDPDEISKAMSELNLAVFPSRVEGLGVSVIEAMASGVPVLASRNGGLPGLIGEDLQRGDFIELDPESIAKKVSWSIENYPQVVEKALHARRFIEENFNIESNAAELMDVYQELNKRRLTDD